MIFPLGLLTSCAIRDIAISGDFTVENQSGQTVKVEMAETCRSDFPKELVLADGESFTWHGLSGKHGVDMFRPGCAPVKMYFDGKLEGTFGSNDADPRNILYRMNYQLVSQEKTIEKYRMIIE